MKSYAGWIIIVCFFAALIGGFFILKNSSSGDPSTPFTLSTSSATSTSSTTTGSRTAPDGYKEYRSEQFGFSILYPQEFTPKEFVDHGPELTVVFQGGEGQPGFQIYASPIDGTQITPERFKRDEPSGVRLEPHVATVAGVQAVAFEGFDAKMGKTSEFWFIHTAKGVPFLYEVSTYKELSPWLSNILQTWQFL